MNNRIVLFNFATTLSEEEIGTVSGGWVYDDTGDGGGDTGLSGPKSTNKQTAIGGGLTQTDTDTSVADF